MLGNLIEGANDLGLEAVGGRTRKRQLKVKRGKWVVRTTGGQGGGPLK